MTRGAILRRLSQLGLEVFEAGLGAPQLGWELDRPPRIDIADPMSIACASLTASSGGMSTLSAHDLTSAGR
jgi:hypothetical protein